MLVVLLAACQERVESYPDAWTSAHEVCAEDYGLGSMTMGYAASEACLEHVALDVGDEDDLITSTAAMLVRFDEFDPWFYNMVAANVDDVEYDWLQGSIRTDDVAASYDRSQKKVTLYELFNSPLTELFILVHEAGHGRPFDRGHRRCTYGPADGTEVCDYDLEGAHGAALDLLNSIGTGTDDADINSLVEELTDYTESRIELPAD